MRIVRGYRTELDPTRAQRDQLLRTAGVARWAYNWGLQRKLEGYRTTGRSPDAMELHRELNALKRERFTWLYEVSKCAPQEALRDLDRAFLNFWRARKAGRRWGFPRFKSRKRSGKSFRLTGKIVLGAASVRLPRIGYVRLKERGYLPTATDRLLSITVTEVAGRWFVAAKVEEELSVPTNDGPTVGIDLGVLNWVTTSEGMTYQAPGQLARLDRKLRRAQRSQSRKLRGSANRDKAVLTVARIHRRIHNVRTDTLHKITTELTRTKSVIVIEDLNVSAMVRHPKLARAISARTFAMFRQFLEYKARWQGSKVVVAPAFYPSSRKCSCAGCDHIDSALRLGDRVYTCGRCGCSRDRDLNAALNLRNVAVSSTDTRNACGERVSPSAGRPCLVKQELGHPTEDPEERSMASTPASLHA